MVTITETATNIVEQCGNCRFCVHVPAHECHRFPPSISHAQGQWISGWPVVSLADWCGEWQVTSPTPKKGNAER
jgi:hypothetical protein